MSTGPWWTWPMVRIIGWSWFVLIDINGLLVSITYDRSPAYLVVGAVVLAVALIANEQRIRRSRKSVTR